MTYRSSYLAMASRRYMDSSSSPLMPTEAAMAGWARRPRRTSRMCERMAARRRRASSTGPVSPAVNSPARYSSGMRISETAVSSTLWSSPSRPAAATSSTTGLSGGMYHTMGMVRYSGCSGRATS